MPQLLLNRSAEVGLRNLVALEVCRSHIQIHHSGYAFLMHNIIKTVEGSAILRRREMLVSDHHSDVQVMEMFKDLKNNINHSYELQHGYYADIYKNMEMQHGLYTATGTMRKVSRFL